MVQIYPRIYIFSKEHLIDNPYINTYNGDTGVRYVQNNEVMFYDKYKNPIIDKSREMTIDEIKEYNYLTLKQSILTTN